MNLFGASSKNTRHYRVIEELLMGQEYGILWKDPKKLKHFRIKFLHLVQNARRRGLNFKTKVKYRTRTKVYELIITRIPVKDEQLNSDSAKD